MSDVPEEKEDQTSGGNAVTTDSGIPVAGFYGPTPRDSDRKDETDRPGVFPYTRGIHETMYRGRLWTMRQYAGFGTAKDTNERYHYLLARGQSGLSVAFDLPTQMGYDSDASLAQGEVGRAGVAIDSIEDMRVLFRGIDLGQVSTSMTINSTAAIVLALYVAVADESGVPRGALRGTVQNDILKEYIARGTYIYPVAPSLRLVRDLLSFCSEQVPLWNSVSISGYHIREAGATAPQEIAFTFANGIEYVTEALEAGLNLDDFAPRLSFFFAAHNDFLEEVAKFRAARRLWARIMRDRFGAGDHSCRLRFHAQTGGSMLTAQQPLNNIARVTLQAMAAVLGGTQSLHTNGYDEALALPTEESARIALRTQQILAFESGVTRTPDPLAGSYYVEALTDEIEDRATRHLDRIEELGGAASAIGYMQETIHQSAYRFQTQVESGDRTVVGVNRFEEEEEGGRVEQPDFRELETRQRSRLAECRSQRDRAEVDRALAEVRSAAAGTANLLPPMIDAVKASVTLGEISDTLRQEWGSFDG